MRTRVGQDFATGLLFIVIGVGAILTIQFYDRLPMGIPQRPGTGVLPLILSWCLVGSGGLLIIKAVLAGDTALSRFAWRPLFLVTIAIIAFGLLVDGAGLVIAMVAALTLCALGTPETRWPEFAVFLVIMLAVGVGVFVWLLGMPIPIGPVRMPDWLSVILR
ncbi:MAG: tripartite tricarboxylate transporter TctB family protein [Hyphomicrobiaceae bacterium]|nr:tripartite tricarboxylate transporter TctB family protein [Hyphomicrobiaceae bacterium]